MKAMIKLTVIALLMVGCTTTGTGTASHHVCSSTPRTCNK